MARGRHRAVATLAISVVARLNKLLGPLGMGNRAIASFVAKSRASLLGLRATSDTLLGSFTHLGAGIAAFAGGALYAMHRITDAGEQFQRSMKQSLAIAEGVTSATYKRMTQTAFDVARTTKFSSKEAAGGYYHLIAAGLDVEQSIAALPLVAKYAQAGMFDLAKASEYLIDSVTTLGMRSKDPTKNLAAMTRVAEVLARAANETTGTVEQLSMSLFERAAASMRAFKIPLEEGVAVLSAFTAAGTKGEEAGTAFDIIVRDLTTKFIKHTEVFRAYNVTVFDAAGNLRPLAKIIGDLEYAFAGLSTEQRKTALLQMGFADRSVNFINKLIGFSSRIVEYTAAFKGLGNTLDKMAKEQLTPFWSATQRLSAAWTEFSNTLEPLKRGLGELVDEFAKLINKANEWVALDLGKAKKGGRSFLGTIIEKGATAWGYIGEEIAATQAMVTTGAARLMGVLGHGIITRALEDTAQGFWQKAYGVPAALQPGATAPREVTLQRWLSATENERDRKARREHWTANINDISKRIAGWTHNAELWMTHGGNTAILAALAPLGMWGITRGGPLGAMATAAPKMEHITQGSMRFIPELMALPWQKGTRRETQLVQDPTVVTQLKSMTNSLVAAIEGGMVGEVGD